MKNLVVYYSRTGTTKKVADDISKILKSDKEQILDVKKRNGLLGYLISGREASFRKLPKIKKTRKNPEEYGLVIIGTPIWAHTMSSPIRTYISKNKKKFKKVAFFCTMGGSGSKSTFKHMENLCGKKPVALLRLKTKEVMKDNYTKKVKEFIKKVKS